MKLGPQKILEQESAILGGYPNTYTYTKSLAERYLKKRRGNLPVSIVRPSIIIANYDDPFDGWIDTLAASGGVILAVSSGVMHFVRSDGNGIMDLIPCDFVSNQIIVQTVVAAKYGGPILNVIHSATTTRNPISVYKIRDHILNYSKYTPWYGRVAYPWAYPIP